MKSRLFASCAAMLGLSFLAGMPGWAATQVTLSSRIQPCRTGLDDDSVARFRFSDRFDH